MIEHTHFRTALTRSPFIERIEAMTRTENWATWNTYKTPRVVDNLSNEYFAARSSCSVMDLTPMEKYRIRGPEAYAYLDRLVTRDVSKLAPGKVTYVAWCNDDGMVVDDGTVFQLGDNDYRLCAQQHQLDWLRLSALGFDVEIEVETHDIAALAVQGPTAWSVLDAAGFKGLESLPPFQMTTVTFKGTDILVSRTGYTGDLGYELWMAPAVALDVWDALFSVQARYDVKCLGLDALEMLRIEAGFIMPGFDFMIAEAAVRDGRARSPFEAGIGWLVNLDKGPFTGRRALRAEKARPAMRRLIKLVVEGNKPVGEAYLFKGRNGRQVGEVRCTTWSPILKANLALADVNFIDGKRPGNLWARFDYQKEIQWSSGWARCEFRAKPFYNPEHRFATPPNPY
ncbi:MAG: aminomethyltransferase family protein [Pseudomonadota bacterium]